MDQQHWDAEDCDDAGEAPLPTESETQPDTFYLALKLALARLREYSSAAAP